MLKNLKRSTIFILTILFLIVITTLSLGAVIPPAENVNGQTSLTQKNSTTATKWPGLGMHLDSTSDNLWYAPDSVFEGHVDTLVSNGFEMLRIDIPGYSDTEAVNHSKAAVLKAVARGAKVIWGVCGGGDITAGSWGSQREAILSAARWAQDNGVYEFQIGNEEEKNVDGTTITAAQIRNNLKAVATEAQAIFTRGNISYSMCERTSIEAWNSIGRGDIDVLAYNTYVNADNSEEWNWWKKDISLLVSYFGSDHTYLTEFAPSFVSLNSYSSDEAVQAEAVADMVDYIKSSGITRAIYFNYYDDARPFGPTGFGVLKEDGTYRMLWSYFTKML
jgi:hypothetical protein